MESHIVFAFAVFAILTTVGIGSSIAKSTPPPISSEECAKLKYIHADAEKKDNLCLEEGVFAIEGSCQDYYRCDSKLQDFFEGCPSGQHFNGSGCSSPVDGSADCPQKLCFIVYEDKSTANSTMSTDEVSVENPDGASTDNPDSTEAQGAGATSTEKSKSESPSNLKLKNANSGTSMEVPVLKTIIQMICIGIAFKWNL